MHIHILGICGSFMGGLALLARAAGHQVTGCDENVYPPMSTQLEAQGISLIEGYDAAQCALRPDLFIIGNVVSRGNPLMEAILEAGLPYQSGPQWLGDNVLRSRHVLAVAGTHGKTTTSSMLAWILQEAGLNPSFLVGGIAQDFGISARLTDSRHFVIEADEYDTAFFDKRSKFVHYHPRTAILNNLEFDHADIFADLAAIQTQFHHFVRLIPQSGRIIRPAQCEALDRVLERGCWSEVSTVDGPAGWHAHPTTQAHVFDIFNGAQWIASLDWPLTGAHNRSNALAAIAAAAHIGVDPKQAIAALQRFQG
ncbi:MAG: UDP-N-acetylmuramate:L-alanyl-gamma-D-glutamyl-meso-diaminopimelate ligase, partial [Pigmentiphaga sp.]|nr:UDP-N-acetylmuramate:L-alanyl-gamma-D-glutamyl-meso-diaminopimelate ligase [Pigmentiphaga sp.]